MKRALFNGSKVLPYTSGDAIDRSGFLSAVLAVKAAAKGEVSVAVTHCDTQGGSYTAVDDPRLFVGCTGKVDEAQSEDVVVFNIDLLGCKQFVKLTTSGAGAAEAPCALVLGDPAKAPVEGANLGE